MSTHSFISRRISSHWIRRYRAQAICVCSCWHSHLAAFDQSSSDWLVGSVTAAIVQRMRCNRNTPTISTSQLCNTKERCEAQRKERSKRKANEVVKWSWCIFLFATRNVFATCNMFDAVDKVVRSVLNEYFVTEFFFFFEDNFKFYIGLYVFRITNNNAFY